MQRGGEFFRASDSGPILAKVDEDERAQLTERNKSS